VPPANPSTMSTQSICGARSDNLHGERPEFGARDQNASAGLIDHGCALCARQPRIEVWQIAPIPIIGVHGLDMGLSVPGESGNAVAEARAQIVEHRRYAQASRVELRIPDAIDAPPLSTGDDLSEWMPFGRMCQEFVERQGK